MRAGTGVAVHGHVPVQPPGRRQRHAARPPIRQRRPRRAAGRLRAGVVRIHRSSGRPARRRPAPTTLGSRSTRACCPASTSCSTFREHNQPWVDWLGELGYDIVAGIDPAARHRARAARGAQHRRLPDRPRRRLDRRPDRAVVRAPQLPPAAPAVLGAGRVGARLRPATSAIRFRPIHDSPFHERLLTIPVAAAPTDPAELAHLRAQYFGMISHVDHQLGRLWDALRRPRRVGRHR